MGDVTTIGLDIAKSAFQAHGADAKATTSRLYEAPPKAGPERQETT